MAEDDSPARANRRKLTKGREVRGTMDQAALARTPQLFDQSATTIVAELLQNARRAGATRVHVRVERRPEGEVAVFEDDGRGVDDLRALVTFGRSGWDAATAPAESWAGMGVFALASRGCTVTSLGRRAVLTPDVFIGRASATLENAPFNHGTTVSFPLQGAWSRPGALSAAGELDEAITREAIYCPIAVTLDGYPVPQAPYLEYAVETFVIDGVAVGFYDSEAWDRRDPMFQPWDLGGISAPAARHRPGHFNVNFWGHAVEAPTRVHVPNGDEAWTALWDIREDARIRLKLPTRDTVIQDDAWVQLHGKTELAICALVARRPHRLPMETVKFARQFGMAIPDPEMVLRPLVPFYLERMSARTVEAAPDTTAAPPVQDGEAEDWIIVPDDWPPSVLHAIFAAARRMPPAPKLALGDSSLAGLPAYDALPRLERVDLRIVDAGGQEHLVDNFQALDEALETSPAFELLAGLAERSRGNNRAGAARLIEVTLSVGPTAGPTRASGASQRAFGAVSVPCVFAADDFSFPEEVPVLVSEQLTTQGLDEAAREIAAVVYDDVAIELDDDGGEYGDPFWDWLQDMRHQIAESCMESGRFRLHQAWVAASWLAQLREMASGESDIASIRITAEPPKPGGTARRLTITVTDRSGREASRNFDGPLPREPREPPGTSFLDGIEP